MSKKNTDGWHAGDAHCTLHYPDADSGEEAAKEYVDSGDWGTIDKTTWIEVTTWRENVYEEQIDLEYHVITLEPDEPECEGDHEHEWCAPYSLLGGLKENPGVWGKGGGTISREICKHCGWYRVTDTWAQGPGGSQGLTTIEYLPPCEDSLAWVGGKFR